MNPHNISKRYEINGNFFSHKLNGISVFVLPDSPEGQVIQMQFRRQSGFGIKMSELDWYHLRNPTKLEQDLARRKFNEEKKIEDKYKQYVKTRGFKWDD